MSPVGTLLILALAGLLGAIAAASHSPRIWLGATLAGTGVLLAAAVAVLVGGAQGAQWEWRGTWTVGGDPIHLRLDGLSAWFLALVAVVGGAGAVYSREYWSDERHPRAAARGRRWWCALVLCMGLILIVSNGLHFLIAWEGFVVSCYFLITLDQRQPGSREAGWLYLAASHVGTLCLFAFFAILAARRGTWDLGPMREEAALAPLFWLALAGFGIKAGLFPLHIWLPSAHANAPSHVSAIMSGVVIKMGIYGLMRFSGWLPTPPAAGWVVAALGLASAVLGVAFALGQHDLKRLLAYHSVENIGIILIGLGFAMIAASRGGAVWGGLALAGALLHVWNHGLFKALLFLGAGAVAHATGTREMSRLGGLWRRMPWTAGLFALGAVAIAGLPPLNGFVSEWLVYLGLFDAVPGRDAASLAAVAAAVLLAMTGAMALACFIKVCAVVFLGAARTEASARAHECGRTMRGPMMVLAFLCAAIGLAPAALWPARVSAAAAWRGPEAAPRVPPALATVGLCSLALAVLAAAAAVGLWRYARDRGLRRAPTWACGYAAPTARMQYTAGSFAGIITEWFSWILRPEKHEERPEGILPLRASFATHTPETVLERVVAPAGGWVMRVAVGARQLQHGRLPSYFIYILAGLAGLAALVLLG